ncbi:MAG: RNA polymerase subunit sigma-24, partial [Roseibium sp.]|nr:RNA polymerase subunit sigma-24 [Roseibium sp.]
INGMRGLVLHNGERIETALTLGFTENGFVDQLFLIRNPEKLARLEDTVHCDAKSGALWH